MKGILQYCSTDDGTYKNVGTSRSANDHQYTVIPITGKNRINEPEIMGYKVNVQAKVLELNTDFLDYTQWYFRFIFTTELEMIKLSQRTYTVDYDAQITRNEIMFYIVRVEFEITTSDLDDYTDPVALPAGEGGVSVDDSGIYIE